LDESQICVSINPRHDKPSLDEGLLLRSNTYTTTKTLALKCWLDKDLSKPDELDVNVLNLHIIDLARKYYTHLQREIEKEEEGEKEWKNSH
jgi:hypothetical protein